jgi:ribosome-associated protein
MLRVTDTIGLSESEIHFKFIRSPGPGGQHVNRAATGVQLRFDVRHSASLPEYVRRRLLQSLRGRISSEGILIITATRFRSQDLNRKDAVGRLASLIAAAARRVKVRRKTKPTAGSMRKKKERKERRSSLKRSRQKVGPGPDHY